MRRRLELLAVLLLRQLLCAEGTPAFAALAAPPSRARSTCRSEKPPALPLLHPRSVPPAHRTTMGAVDSGQKKPSMEAKGDAVGARPTKREMYRALRMSAREAAGGRGHAHAEAMEHLHALEVCILRKLLAIVSFYRKLTRH
jgi:hypothetical protein